jgi:hypothetical protein
MIEPATGQPALCPTCALKKMCILALDRYTLQPGEKLTVTLTVCNTGTRAGSEVVQLSASSSDIRQRAWVTLSTEWVEPVNREPTRSTIRA